jgi:CopG family nickel-responsive transcriptional regulator
VFNHHTRELAKRLTDVHHAHHELHVATLHVHLDHESCLELAVLRGDAPMVREFATSVIAERGVTHGQVNFIPATVETEAHTHHVDGHAHGHLHTHPRD